jgi:regulation of enolase protein 1 (concanavalin A-like superfamily)
MVALCEGASEKAVADFGQCAQLAREYGGALDEAWATSDLGRAYLAKGDLGQAATQFERALALAGPAGLEQFPHLFALALNGLEQVQGPEAFRVACRQIQRDTAHARFRDWFLRPMSGEVPGRGALCRGAAIADRFAGSLSSEWSWSDPFGDCSYVVRNGLEIYAANGRDLTDVNQSAPRILRPASGEFTVEAACAPVSDDRPPIGGVLLWCDAQNFVRLDRGTRGAFEISFGGCVEGKNVLCGRGLLPAERSTDPEERIILRLERDGDRVSAFCSTDREAWFMVGSIAFPTDVRVGVGLYAIGAIDRTVYPAAYADGTAIRFESFWLWEV